MSVFLHVDFRRCTACFACETACRAAHGSDSRIQLTFVDGLPVPLMCRHCEHSPCAAVCPEHALVWDPNHGVVLLADRCTRCGLCAVACPFGVLSVNPVGQPGVVKCDLCRARREEGKRPACVLTCPTEAITDELEHPLRRRRLTTPVFPIAEKTFGPSWMGFHRLHEKGTGRFRKENLR